MSLLLIGIDVTAVNIALPTVRHELGGGIEAQQWIVDAYTVALASLLMSSGALADRWGRRATFRLGLALFAAASLACALAPSIGWLILFRTAQGVGGSMLTPVAMAILRAVFVSERDRARALGIWAGVFGVAMALGPALGGLLLGAGFSWRAIFWINLPLALITLALTAVVPESRAPVPRRADLIGQLLLASGLAAITAAVIEAPHRGWASPLVLGCLGLSALAVAGLAHYQPRCAHPLLDPHLLGNRGLLAAAFTCCIGFAAFGGFSFLATLYLQTVRGYSPLDAALVLTPLAVTTALAGLLSGRLVTRYGPRAPLRMSGAAISVSALMLTGLTATTSTAWLQTSWMLFGSGFGMISAPTNHAALAAAPAAQAGAAAAITSTARQMGQVFGVAVLGSVLAAGLAAPQHHAAPNSPSSLGPQFAGGYRADFSGATHLVWWLLVGCGASIVALAGVSSHPRCASSPPDYRPPKLAAVAARAPSVATDDITTHHTGDHSVRSPRIGPLTTLATHPATFKSTRHHLAPSAKPRPAYAPTYRRIGRLDRAPASSPNSTTW